MSQTENERQQDRNEKFAQELLDSYFLFRRPLPETGFFQENKTTLEVMDELMPMMAVPTETVVAYLLDHEYHCTTEQDGTVTWAIWRQA